MSKSDDLTALAKRMGELWEKAKDDLDDEMPPLSEPVIQQEKPAAAEQESGDGYANYERLFLEPKEGARIFDDKKVILQSQDLQNKGMMIFIKDDKRNFYLGNCFNTDSTEFERVINDEMSVFNARNPDMKNAEIYLLLTVIPEDFLENIDYLNKKYGSQLLGGKIKTHVMNFFLDSYFVIDGNLHKADKEYIKAPTCLTGEDYLTPQDAQKINEIETVIEKSPLPDEELSLLIRSKEIFFLAATIVTNKARFCDLTYDNKSYATTGGIRSDFLENSAVKKLLKAMADCKEQFHDLINTNAIELIKKDPLKSAIKKANFALDGHFGSQSDDKSKIIALLMIKNFFDAQDELQEKLKLPKTDVSAAKAQQSASIKAKTKGK